ncbi:hypothetical protein Pelo_8843 [Pelomyxa schiedti]|nr:hypothetical protein Pelo_8843 [Pelomyxa schiedti]
MSQQRGSSSKKKRGGAGGGSSKSRAVGGEGVTSVDPADLYFTHSKIRPTFSCGRPLMVTLESIRNGTITPEDLPIITAMVQGDTMYSLNNRRLYVFKQCRKEGLLTNNEVCFSLHSRIPFNAIHQITTRKKTNKSPKKRSRLGSKMYQIVGD